MKHKRRAWLAGILNLIMPGLGHLYLGLWKKAIIYFCISVILINISFFLLPYDSIKPFNVIIPIGIIILYPVILLVIAVFNSLKIKEYQLKKYNRWYYYLILLILYAIATELIYFNVFKYTAYKFPSQSMENTLFVGDFILCDDNYYELNTPQRGDLVVFIFPRDGVTKYIKRCVGLPGDTVSIVDKLLFINNQQQEHYAKYIDTSSDGSQIIQPRRLDDRDSRDNFGPYVVPKNNYFMMGDNRDNSYDSRYWGTVNKDLFLGKVLVIHWSDDFNRIGTVIK